MRDCPPRSCCQSRYPTPRTMRDRPATIDWPFADPEHARKSGSLPRLSPPTRSWFGSRNRTSPLSSGRPLPSPPTVRSNGLKDLGELGQNVCKRLALFESERSLSRRGRAIDLLRRNQLRPLSRGYEFLTDALCLLLPRPMLAKRVEYASVCRVDSGYEVTNT